jgi:hypothetical protein
MTWRLAGVRKRKSRDGTNSQYRWRFQGSKKNKVDIGTLEDDVEDVFCPLWRKKNDRPS